MPLIQVTGNATTGSTAATAFVATPVLPGSDPYAIVQISGTYTSVQGLIEGSLDSGVTYGPIVAARMERPALQFDTISPANSATRQWQVPVGAYTNIRWRNTGIGTGSVAVRILTSSSSLLPYPSSALMLGPESDEWTYAGHGVGLAVVTAATDFATITGSATRTVYVKKAYFSGTVATAVISPPISLVLRSTAATGGTPAANNALALPIALDTNAPTATATLNAYTANPTAGTLAAFITSAIYTLNITTTFATGGTSAPFLEFDLTKMFGPQGVVLRGITQQLALNANATTFANATLCNYGFVWQER